ncbi:Pyrimidine deaminase domain of riboflavin biosynthesis-containing protein RibD [Ferrimonas sediminum]|uniref:Pyrimidine deaminase domain of riboflavin biosynthesis-containing protein RibD n=1 Tax=Ferrimonas sediminum TaxID=718193 RepID=A0A1G8WH17_9GAMM|nr:bifunctional diaminohydroxyphosphoribosylaminopyrimidine deaminase/5-amino-6-(5-phosphoribosylamino)uracil reductase RibD [Ferrimonas sediminum]SDJ77433.1 Pyrimidine deaminase domain of riboflavin biosynthesis-containing protein RibD [Ferrimonas sediminum]
MSELLKTPTDAHPMLRALALSKQALPQCQPNPPVGCVLVKGGQVVAEGFTQAIGGNHAEVEALNRYSGSMEGVTAYVTLEPCSFVGRTPACARTLVQTGIKNVVVAMLDPDPRNSGKGIAILEQAGVSVEVGVHQQAVSEFLTPYLGKS